MVSHIFALCENKFLLSDIHPKYSHDPKQDQSAASCTKVESSDSPSHIQQS